jgi:NAD(P)-dependent dehydrogenase (short-subunit alcohol dehydrogenase family)
MTLFSRRTPGSVSDPLRESLLVAAAAGIGLCLAARALVRSRRRFDFAGKVVFITGGSRGLGLVLARRFADEGARLAICARDPDELERARFDLASRGAEVLAVQCDVTNQIDVNEAIQRIVGHYGGIDVLVNNAGVISVGPMEVQDITDYERAMATHFWGPLYTTMAVLPVMRPQGQGRIVNVSSIGGKIAVPHLLPYSASKFALVGFSEGLRAELAKDGIYVTTVCPGLMRTGSPRNALFKGRHEAEYAWFAISDSLPVTSMDAGRAARQIVEACRYGEAEVVLSLQAKLAVKFHALFTGLTTDLNALVNRALPGLGNNGHTAHLGKESESKWTQGWPTALSEKAARQNNEF